MDVRAYVLRMRALNVRAATKTPDGFNARNNVPGFSLIYSPVSEEKVGGQNLEKISMADG